MVNLSKLVHVVGIDDSTEQSTQVDLVRAHWEPMTSTPQLETTRIAPTIGVLVQVSSL